MASLPARCLHTPHEQQIAGRCRHWCPCLQSSKARWGPVPSVGVACRSWKLTSRLGLGSCRGRRSSSSSSCCTSGRRTQRRGGGRRSCRPSACSTAPPPPSPPWPPPVPAPLISSHRPTAWLPFFLDLPAAYLQAALPHPVGCLELCRKLSAVVVLGPADRETASMPQGAEGVKAEDGDGCGTAQAAPSQHGAARRRAAPAAPEAAPIPALASRRGRSCSLRCRPGDPWRCVPLSPSVAPVPGVT